jgi:antitoxin YqcF
MADNSLISLPEHYESSLGEIAGGWTDKKEAHGVQVVFFKDQPELGVTTFATLGLSRHVLEISDKRIRQELLVSANDRFSRDAVAAFLMSFAESVLGRGNALLRGEVVGPAGPVVPGSTLTAVYVTNPSPFAPSLTQFNSAPPPAVFAYLVPISKAEASLVHQRGWRWFEDELETQNPDIWDLARLEEVIGH